MNIVTVIPIKKGVQKEYLSYFSSEKIALGSIVVVPIRFKNVDAIVTEIKDVKDLKGDIKTRNYQLKKIVKVKGPSPFEDSFFKACLQMKDYTNGVLSSVLKTFLPTIFLENFNELNKPNKEEQLNNESSYANVKGEKLIFQTSFPDRVSWYRTLIRESFAKKESVFLCVPTHFDINKFKNELAKGIEKYVLVFNSKIPKKKLIDNYNKAVKEQHPILIIGTGMFLSVPRHDIKTVILEHESSKAYKSLSRPFLDIRSFAEILCSITKTKLILGDTLLRPETIYRNEIKEFGEIRTPIFRLSQINRQVVIDMKKEKSSQKDFSIFSEETIKLVDRALKEKESIFLFTVRKGLAPVTVCHDCNNVLLCPNCGAPIVLYKTKQKSDSHIGTKNIFMCNKCGAKESTEVRCPHCSSWNLRPLGIGTERVYEEIKTLFPKANIIQIDKGNTPTAKTVNSAISNLQKNPGSILIGTEMVFSYLDAKLDHSVIVSLDGLLSIPSFNITQRILHIIEKLNYLTNKNLLIQTRLEDNLILRHIATGNVLPLYREEIKDRKNFGYPPFKKLIKITFSGTAKETEKAREFISKLLAEYDPQVFSAFIGKVKGQYITNTVIKLNPQIWPLPVTDKLKVNPELARKLSSLPNSFSINIDPEDLL